MEISVRMCGFLIVNEFLENIFKFFLGKDRYEFGLVTISGEDILVLDEVINGV